MQIWCCKFRHLSLSLRNLNQNRYFWGKQIPNRYQILRKVSIRYQVSKQIPQYEPCIYIANHTQTLGPPSPMQPPLYGVGQVPTFQNTKFQVRTQGATKSLTIYFLFLFVSPRALFNFQHPCISKPCDQNIGSNRLCLR